MLKKIMAVALMGFLLTSCLPAPQEHIRVTVNVMDNGRLVSGSAVQAWSCRKPNPLWGNMDAGNCTLRGEAVIVNLGYKGLLVMPFTGRTGYNWRAYVNLIASRAPEVTEWEVAPENYPLFVTFSDENRPNTVQAVNVQNTARRWGPGVKIKSVSVKVTDEDVTWGMIDRHLPWASEGDGTFLNGDTATKAQTLPDQLQNYHFLTGRRR